jgi:putative NADH-flavin reductase
MNIKKVCIVGASRKLGQYMVQHALDRGYKVVGVCRDRRQTRRFKGRLTIIPGATNDREVIQKARFWGVTACLPCWFLGVSSNTHLELLRMRSQITFDKKRIHQVCPFIKL